MLSIAVIGHVEHVTMGRVDAVPGPGDIAHLRGPFALAGGGGGLAFWQLVKSPARIHLFTAIGDGEAGAFVAAELAASGATIHAARRAEPHTRDVVMIGPGGDRSIVVIGPPLHPRAVDDLPWELLGELDAVYFTAEDPELLRRARAARVLVATARRREAIAASGVELDAIVGSRGDPREVSERADWSRPPAALIMTEHPRGGVVETEVGRARFATPHVASIDGGTYGAGDSFAAALVYFLAGGLDPLEAASRAAPHGAAVLSQLDPRAAQRPITR
jgi:ribokinase